MKLYDEATDRIYAGRIAALVIAGLALLWALTAGIWGLGVATAGIYGKGEAHKQIESANNRIFAQEHFHQLLADIKTYDQQLGVQQKLLDATTDPAERTRLAQVVGGINDQCFSVRQQYDADAQKISLARFRDAGLPPTIEDFDPQSAVDCKGGTS